jgi:signal transduction histidine kinase
MISSSDILKASLLIVDDQAANVSLLEQLLRDSGYVSIASTRNPHEVCDLHRQNRYDLILLDLQMPGMDGFQVMEGLKEIETDGYLPVIVITALPGHKLRALKTGAKDFVSKPFDLGEVLIRVYNMIEVRLLHQEIKRLHDKLAAENALLQEEISERKQLAELLRSAQAQLFVYTGELERLVAERTAELTATNQRLEASVDSIKKGAEEYRVLFLESQIMQRKMTQMTRQIITAQEEERKQISRELHDEVVQALIAINLELATLKIGATATLKKKIAHTQQLVESSVNAVHRFARKLRPAVLDDLGLIPALHAYIKSLAERGKIKIHLTAFGGVEALGADERTVLFRVAQEALTNIVRHAHATLVKINIVEISGAIRMEISDNGKSFPVEKTVSSKNPKRLGLVGMKERVEIVGGSLTIESAPGKGTTVRAEIPFTLEKPKK